MIYLKRIEFILINLKGKTFFKSNEFREGENGTRINTGKADFKADFTIKNNLTSSFNLIDQVQSAFYYSGLTQGFSGGCLKKMEVAIDRM